METATFARTTWSAVRDREPWPALVHDAFHPAYLGIGEAYQDITDVAGKIAAMSRFPDDLLACTARSGQDLVGLLVGGTGGTRLVIYDLFVASAYRRRGVGRRLVEMAMSGAGATLVAAEVNRDNDASSALFESMGFRRVRTSDWFEVR